MLEIRLQLTSRQQITQGESTIIPKLAPTPSGGVSNLCDWYSFPYCLSAAAKDLQTPRFWVFLSSGACHLDDWRLTQGRQDFMNVYVMSQNEHYPTTPQIPGRAWQVPPFYEWGLGGTIVRAAGGNPSRSDLKTQWLCLEDRCPLQWQRAQQELRDIHSCWAATEKAGKSEVLGNNLYPLVNLRHL